MALAQRPLAWFEAQSARLARPLNRLVASRVTLDAVLVVGAVFVVFRLLNLYPWNVPVLDFHAYWESRDVINYGAYGPFVIGAFLYSPAFAHLIAPITALPWQVFAGIWTAILVGAFVWLTGRWALPILLTSVAVALELYLGQVDILIAAAIVIGFRYPAAWAFPILTKVAPGIGLLWFVFRREWRNLLIALSVTAAVAAISAIIAPELWRGWFDLLTRSVTQRQTITGSYLNIPLWARLPAAVALLWWGARSDRYWTVPVAAFLAMPILWLNVFTILLGAVPLLSSAGHTPAREWLFGERVPGRAPRWVRGLVRGLARRGSRRGAHWPVT
jgi:hypothetical protein